MDRRMERNERKKVRYGGWEEKVGWERRQTNQKKNEGRRGRKTERKGRRKGK